MINDVKDLKKGYYFLSNDKNERSKLFKCDYNEKAEEYVFTFVGSNQHILSSELYPGTTIEPVRIVEESMYLGILEELETLKGDNISLKNEIEEMKEHKEIADEKCENLENRIEDLLDEIAQLS